MFTDEEINLLTSAHQTFDKRSNVFDMLSEADWKEAGIENWVQIELAVALRKNYNATIVGKKERGCDLIVEYKSGLKVGIEIKALTRPSFNSLENGIEEHPDADLYFYICRFDEKELNKCKEKLCKQGFVEKHRKFNDWIVMLVKKAKCVC